MVSTEASASKTAKTKVRVSRQTPTVLGWCSDAFSIDHFHHDDDHVTRTDKNNNNNSSASGIRQRPHTVLVFVPGNPGLIQWYIPMFVTLVQKLGPGYCARGVANAGHSIDPNRVNVVAAVAENTTDSSPRRDVCIPWSVDGQALHKAAYMDLLMEEFRGSSNTNNNAATQQQQQQQLPRFIFVAHSIGMHFTQRVLLFRPDIMARTQMVLGLMPFIRMHAPWQNQTFLNFAASIPETTVQIHERILRILSQLPVSVTKCLLRSSMKDPDGLAVATQLVRQPPFARNFFLLGTEEIRDVPQCLDQHALNYITSSGISQSSISSTNGQQQQQQQCPIAMLFAANDQWAPTSHLDALRQWQEQHDPEQKLLFLEHNPVLKHDFVSVPEQVGPVVEFCLRHITNLQQQQQQQQQPARIKIMHQSRL